MRMHISVCGTSGKLQLLDIVENPSPLHLALQPARCVSPDGQLYASTQADITHTHTPLFALSLKLHMLVCFRAFKTN